MCCKASEIAVVHRNHSSDWSHAAVAAAVLHTQWGCRDRQDRTEGTKCKERQYWGYRKARNANNFELMHTQRHTWRQHGAQLVSLCVSSVATMQTRFAYMEPFPHIISVARIAFSCEANIPTHTRAEHAVVHSTHTNISHLVVDRRSRLPRNSNNYSKNNESALKTTEYICIRIHTI